ncbi:MAG TPA: 30S ribosomal protein S2 [Solirubrobacteraceae bacterium]
MASVGIRELLEAGVHFGHQTRRWNPKMRRFIFGERAGIYIIDLLKTERLLDSAQDFASSVAHRGGNVLFVGTKKQARDAIKEVAESAGMPYVNHRWLGGLLTNFQTISLRIKRLHDLEGYEANGQLQLLPTRERLSAEADLEKLRANLGGVKHMQRPPDALFVVDLKTEAIAVREAQRLRIPIIGLVDTNVDPDGIDYVIPGNDDAMKSCRIITQAIGDVVSRGRQTFREEEERSRREAEEATRREAEERARREAEEEERRAAEAAAAEATLVQGGEGLPRNEAEQVVADAVQQGGRRRVEGRRPAEAGAAAQAADEPGMPAVGNVGPGVREERNNPNVGDRVPQEAGAPAGAGSPASDTAGEAEKDAPAKRARQSARRAKTADAPVAPAPEPGPSPIAQEAVAEAPPAAPTPGSVAAEAAPADAPAVEPEPVQDAPAAAAEDGTPDLPEAGGGDAPSADEGGDEAGDDADKGPIDQAQAVVNAAVDTAQDVANTAVDTTQDVVAGAASTAASVADTVGDVLPGPLGGLAKAAAGAADAAAGAVADRDKDAKDETETENTEESK